MMPCMSRVTDTSRIGKVIVVIQAPIKEHVLWVTPFMNALMMSVSCITSNVLRFYLYCPVEICTAPRYLGCYRKWIYTKNNAI